jgi:hypothetical protein
VHYFHSRLPRFSRFLGFLARNPLSIGRCDADIRRRGKQTRQKGHCHRNSRLALSLALAFDRRFEAS